MRHRAAMIYDDEGMSGAETARISRLVGQDSGTAAGSRLGREGDVGGQRRLAGAALLLCDRMTTAMACDSVGAVQYSG
jgi:hypothetical protein